jgi:hypothetical protein
MKFSNKDSPRWYLEVITQEERRRSTIVKGEYKQALSTTFLRSFAMPSFQTLFIYAFERVERLQKEIQGWGWM